MRGNNLTVLKIFDEWQSFILKRNRKVSLFDGVGFVRLACCPSSVRAFGPATLSVGEGFLRRGLQPGSAYRPTPVRAVKKRCHCEPVTDVTGVAISRIEVNPLDFRT